MSLKLLNKKYFTIFNSFVYNSRQAKTYLTSRLFCDLNQNSIKTKLISNKINNTLLNQSIIKFSSFYHYFHNDCKHFVNISLINKIVNNQLISNRKLSQSPESDDPNDNRWSNASPFLMEFVPKLWPNFWYKWTNFVTIHFIIRPFFDNEFNLDSFMLGSKQALVQISNCLADRSIESLKDLVSDQALSEISSNLKLFNAKQLEELRTQLEDILYSFPYRIGIIMNDDDNKRFVEITVVYYTLYKFQILKDKPDLSFQEFKSKYGNSITVCNYRFIREYTKGVKSDWTVNLLGHFKNSYK